MPISFDNLCQCERDKHRIHCPHCGLLNFYARKQRITRPHPVTGEMTDNIIVFRCRTCGKDFDDLQWQFECKAPPSLRSQKVKQQALSKESLSRLAESGAKFDENEKRHFHKIVGIKYDEYMAMWRDMKKLEERQKANAEQAATKILKHPYGPMPIMGDKKITPLQYHIEHCNHCMMNDDLCDVGKQLKIAEGMPQP